jgi:hypothetical protein
MPQANRRVGLTALTTAVVTSCLTAMPANAQPVDAIEYYDAGQDHYFISALPAEIAALDANRFPGWARTGLSFKAYGQATGSASPVCRFYIPPADGDSHFYTASPSECLAVQTKYPAFVYESPNVMYVDLPDPITGACPTGDVPVYRLWDHRADTNHRYTTDPAVRAQMVATGWVAEGYGPNVVIMCAPHDTRGIYIYSNEVGQLGAASVQELTASLGVPGIDGLALVVGWQDLEPSMGQYQWTILDQWIGEAIALGKKIDLVVPAGSSMPGWLFAPSPIGAGAKPLSFTVSPHAGQTGKCDSEVIAAPWDPAFLDRWNRLLSALATHLRSAGTYDKVTLLRLTGINRTSEELRLPRETPQSTGLACVTDAIATWQQANYRPSLIMTAWHSIVASFATNFPDKVFGVSLIPTSGAFPPLDENGAIITGARPDLTQMLLASASQTLPGRLIVQYDFLMPGESASPDVVLAAQTLGTMAAFQANEYLGGQGSGCSEPVTNPAPCSAATFLQMLETGIYPLGPGNPLRAQYIEVFRANAIAFPTAVQQAHSEIVSQP